MLSAQNNSSLPTDALPTQSNTLLDQNQPRVYSLLTGSSSPSPIKPARRKRTMRLDQSSPVIVNPQITRTHTSVPSAGPHHPSSETRPPFVPTHFTDGSSSPLRFCPGHNVYDVNNNINHDQIPSITIPLNTSSAGQAQQAHQWSNNPLSMISARSMPRMSAKTQRSTPNQLSHFPNSERTTPTSSEQHRDYAQQNPTLVFADRRGLISFTDSLPSPLSSRSSSTKPKRKHSKRLHSPFHIDRPQQQLYQYSTTFSQSTVLDGLPSLIPSSIGATYLQFEESPCSKDVTTPSNFVPLTPPASICSMRSPPVNINNEPLSVLNQQYLLVPSANDTADMNLLSQQYSHDHRFTLNSSAINNSYPNGLPFSYQRRLSATHYPQCCMVPSTMVPTNFIPIPSSSVSTSTINTIPSIASVTTAKKEKKNQQKSDEGTRAMQSSETVLLTNGELGICQSPTREIPCTKKRNRRNSHTKKQLNRIARRNRLLVFKFMMQKRKQQKQDRMLLPNKSDVTTEQPVPKPVNTGIVQSVPTETYLPDIVAPSLKISFDAAQKIESITLFYHRRRKPDINNESSSKLLNNADNRLGLLVEAVELMETLQGSSKLALPSLK